jgi:hypothetical protein
MMLGKYSIMMVHVQFVIRCSQKGQFLFDVQFEIRCSQKTPPFVPFPRLNTLIIGRTDVARHNQQWRWRGWLMHERRPEKNRLIYPPVGQAQARAPTGPYFFMMVSM